MIGWLVMLGVIIVAFGLLMLCCYYDLDTSWDEDKFWINIKGHKIRRIKDSEGFYRLQKRYFPGFWKDISKKRIIIPIDDNLRYRFTHTASEIEDGCERHFVIFYPTTSGDSALEFEMNLKKIFEEGKVFVKRTKPIKYKSFVPGKIEKNKKEDNNQNQEPKDQKLD